MKKYIHALLLCLVSIGFVTPENSQAATYYQARADFTLTLQNLRLSEFQTNESVISNRLTLSVFDYFDFGGVPNYSITIDDLIETPPGQTAMTTVNFHMITGYYDAWDASEIALFDAADSSTLFYVKLAQHLELQWNDSTISSNLSCQDAQYCSFLDVYNLMNSGDDQKITDTKNYLMQVQTIGYNQPYYSSPVPLPAAFWLFGSGLTGLVLMRKKASKAPVPSV